MPYEIDFIGIQEETKDADAICFRWKNIYSSYTIGVYDGGFKIHGERINELISNYYYDDQKSEIDFIICSHSDQDHVTGLSEVIDNNVVKTLYMNLPWNHIDELFELVKDGRKTKQSLEDELKKKYQYIAELEQKALENGVEVQSIFQGDLIANRLRVLSPTKDFYLDLLSESDKTPEMEHSTLIESLVKLAKKAVNWITEGWNDENLKENVSTTAENEMSAIVLGSMDEENFLLTGDAGIRALREAIEYSNQINIDLKDSITLYQVPHHGSRRNVSPSILNELLGEVIPEGTQADRISVVCTGSNTDSPKKMVTNAFLRRGVEVYNAKGVTINHRKNIESRQGWSSVTAIEFSEDVEEWS